jgi:hypothetical protein
VNFDDSINDEGVNHAQNYSISIDDGSRTLKLAINAKAMDNSFTNINQKMELLLGTRIEQEIAKAAIALKAVEDKFKAETSLVLPIEIDFSFTKHIKFVEEIPKKSYERLQRYSAIISQLYKTTAPYLMITNSES